MEATAANDFIKRSFEQPDEETAFPKATLQSVQLGPFTVSRMTFEPGWRWTHDLPDIVGTETCEYEHPIWLVLSGRFAIQMNDGRTEEFGPGEFGMIPSGHDAWVIGDEPVEAIDIQAENHSSRES